LDTVKATTPAPNGIIKIQERNRATRINC
jgi:hypothetical protein